LEPLGISAGRRNLKNVKRLQNAEQSQGNQEEEEVDWDRGLRKGAQGIERQASGKKKKKKKRKKQKKKKKKKKKKTDGRTSNLSEASKWGGPASALLKGNILERLRKVGTFWRRSPRIGTSKKDTQGSELKKKKQPSKRGLERSVFLLREEPTL